MNDLLSITAHFRLPGEVREIVPLGSGLINDTYKVVTKSGQPDFVLQRINHHVFQNVDLLQRNIEAVTAHIRQRLEERGENDLDRKTLHFWPAEDGKTYWTDGTTYWRVMTFIPNAVTREAVNPENARLVGLAFGDFEAMLADITDRLGETIPDFHNMEFRLKQLREAVADNKAGRVKEVSY